MKHNQEPSIKNLQGCIIVTLVAAVILLNPTLARKSSSMRTIIRIEEFKNCQDRPNTTEYKKNHNYLSKVNLQRVKMDQYINAEYVVNRAVDSLQANINIMKCEGVEESTCEHLLRMKMSLCDKLSEKGKIWSPLVQTIHPPCRCPMNKPLYKVVNGTFSGMDGMPFVTAIPMGSDYYWRAKVTYPDPKTNTEAGCFYLVFKIYKVKSR